MAGADLMSIGLSALNASYVQLQTTGNNIANADTAGYSVQSANLTASPGQFSGAGYIGSGVTVASVTRASNTFLTQQAQTATSVAAMQDTLSQNLQTLQNEFPLGSSGVGQDMGQFINDFVNVADNPSDSSARQVALSDANVVASAFSTAGQQIQTLQTGATEDMKNDVSQVNSLAQQVATLNSQIALDQGSSQTPNDLLDQRDQLIQQIGNLIQVNTIPASDGTMSVFVAGGQQLVLGTQAQQLSVTPDPANSARSALTISTGNGQTQQLQSSLITGGSLAGLLTYQDQDLVDARNQLGQLAAAFTGSVNQIQTNGLNLNGSTGTAIFTPTTPVAIANANNARNASGNFDASVTLNVTDPTQLQASDYSLVPDPNNSGSYIVTRESDGTQFEMAPDPNNANQYTFTNLSTGASLGDSLDGFQISITGTPAAGDSFELEPVGNAAADMSVALTDPNGIAAACPTTASMGTSNTGTAAVNTLTVSSASTQLNGAITFTDGNGDYSYSLTNASTGQTSTGTGTWTAGQPISVDGMQLTLTGVPNSGDTVNLAKTAYVSQNNGNAVTMSQLGSQTVVGNMMTSDGTATGGESVTDAYSSVLANIGVRVQSAATASTLADANSTTATTAVSNESGVNLDEEAANLIQYQQSYQAAAKIISVAQTVFDTMLNIGSSTT